MTRRREIEDDVVRVRAVLDYPSSGTVIYNAALQALDRLAVLAHKAARDEERVEETRETDRPGFPITTRDLDAVAIAYDELLSYLETVGDEGQLDDEEMPSGKLTWTVARLRSILDRYARFEHLTRSAAAHNQIVEVDSVRFVYRPTPPSGPNPPGEADND